ncbi:MAG: class I SAM-dependent RNA methyltransferase [Salinivirgaceae bacterium]|nr:class I SAM-dependent RNA methyltransferase [Salinivirgaceae bacterium]MDD4747355.1 class I SAM-dependent RNA methyltransferase [Salinivirgaceae bacterium]
MKTFDIIATTLYGLEEILAQEIRQLGVADVTILNRAVKFQGNLETLYKANLLLRTAVKILKPIHAFRATNENQLYSGIKNMNWEEYLTIKKSFAIDAAVHSSFFTHSLYVALKSKDAIVDLYREKYKLRPSVNTENPDLRINVHISESMVIVSLDSSGSTLGKRNYRLEQGDAPINEILAAAIILTAEWDKKVDFIDPMCGSGTFSIEAALIAANIAPGRNRQFTFQTWLDYDAQLFERVKAEADDKIVPIKAKIRALDIDKKAINMAISNARRAGVREFITFEGKDFFETELPNGEGIVVINPPYDERLHVDKVEDFYDEIGSHLKHKYHGCEAWIISSNFDALKRFGLKPSKKIKLFNGSLECRLLKYELYEGSRKMSNPE